MAQHYWLKQADKPLFPELLWSRPENRRHAGKLLIVGGNGYEFKAPANAYGDALAAGIGSARVLLPDSMRKTVEHLFPEADFAPSTVSGSFARPSLSQLLELADWADGVLLAGDIGHNSETAVLLESFATKYTGLLAVGDDVRLPHRSHTLFVRSFTGLQQLATQLKSRRAITSQLDLLQLVEIVRVLSEQKELHIVSQLSEHIIVASGGQVSTTAYTGLMPPLGSIATYASVWWLQNQAKPFEALTTAVYDVSGSR